VDRPALLLQSRADAVLRETDPAVRSGAIQKLVPRALWWFRWGAMGTVIFGLLYLLIWWGMRLNYAMTPWTVADFHRRLPRPVHVGNVGS